jgi:hypothetical protein
MVVLMDHEEAMRVGVVGVLEVDVLESEIKEVRALLWA